MVDRVFFFWSGSCSRALLAAIAEEAFFDIDLVAPFEETGYESLTDW